MRIDRLALAVDGSVLLSFLGASWTGDAVLFFGGVLGLILVLILPSLPGIRLSMPSRRAWARIALALPLLVVVWRLLVLEGSNGGAVNLEVGAGTVAVLIVALLIAYVVWVWVRIWRIFPFVPPRWKTLAYVICLQVFALCFFVFLPASLVTTPAAAEDAAAIVGWSHTIMALSLCFAAALPFLDTSLQRSPPIWSRASR